MNPPLEVRDKVKRLVSVPPRAPRPSYDPLIPLKTTVNDSPRVLVPVPPALLAPMVTAKVPPTKGTPEISPEEVFTLRPGGSPLALKLVGIVGSRDLVIE